MKRIFGMYLAVTVILGSLTGCFSGSNPGRERAGKEIVVATVSESGGLDPAGVIANTFLAYSVSALDGLLVYDEDGEIEYRAAESYEVNEEQTVWIFHLRKESVWSDGSPVTSADFCNTIKRSLDPASGNGYANYLFPIENAEAVYQGEADIKELGVR